MIPQGAASWNFTCGSFCRMLSIQSTYPRHRSAITMLTRYCITCRHMTMTAMARIFRQPTNQNSTRFSDACARPLFSTSADHKSMNLWKHASVASSGSARGARSSSQTFAWPSVGEAKSATHGVAQLRLIQLKKLCFQALASSDWRPLLQILQESVGGSRALNSPRPRRRMRSTYAAAQPMTTYMAAVTRARRERTPKSPRSASSCSAAGRPSQATARLATSQGSSSWGRYPVRRSTSISTCSKDGLASPQLRAKPALARTAPAAAVRPSVAFAVSVATGAALGEATGVVMGMPTGRGGRRSPGGDSPPPAAAVLAPCVVVLPGLGAAGNSLAEVSVGTALRR
mmetsp:Transcript_96399/g.281710  ORF Transcript_96399/g.281710 Transcript_96399/m.281710 type:complete len:343 (+) Transcript_96399:1002-2030(+)